MEFSSPRLRRAVFYTLTTMRLAFEGQKSPNKVILEASALVSWRGLNTSTSI